MTNYTSASTHSLIQKQTCCFAPPASCTSGPTHNHTNQGHNHIRVEKMHCLNYRRSQVISKETNTVKTLIAVPVTYCNKIRSKLSPLSVTFSHSMERRRKNKQTNKKVEEFLGFRTARSIPRQTPSRSEKEKNKTSSITEAGSKPSSTLRRHLTDHGMSASRRFLNTTVPENGLNHTGASAITLFSSTIRPDRTFLSDDCGGLSRMPTPTSPVQPC